VQFLTCAHREFVRLSPIKKPLIWESQTGDRPMSPDLKPPLYLGFYSFVNLFLVIIKVQPRPVAGKSAK